MKEFFLDTERIGFSIWNEEDLRDAIKLWGNPKVTEFISSNDKLSYEQVKERLNNEIEIYNSYKIQYWPIFLKKTNNNIGCCGLKPYDKQKNIYELGIHLKGEYWGKGLAYEACSAVLNYAFYSLKVNAIFAGHNPKNIASSQLLKKLGFTYTHDEFYPPTGLKHPSYVMTKQDHMDI